MRTEDNELSPMPEPKKNGTVDLQIAGDLIIVVGGCTASFLFMYFRGVSHRPEVESVAFVWPLFSFSFLTNAAFACLGAPLFYILYTFPAHFVRPGIRKVLRVLMKGLLILFPIFLLNGNVAYFINGENAYVILNNGTRIELDSPKFEIRGKKSKYYVFNPEDEEPLYSFSFRSSELPEIHR